MNNLPTEYDHLVINGVVFEGKIQNEEIIFISKTGCENFYGQNQVLLKEHNKIMVVGFSSQPKKIEYTNKEFKITIEFRRRWS